MATAPGQPNQMQTAINCDTCENNAKHLCRNCHDRLCDRCKNIHSKSKATFDHEVVLLTLEALTLPECPSSYACKWHPKFRAIIGCQKCEVPVCEKCLIGEHNGHKVIEITQLFQIKIKKLEEKLDVVRSEHPKFESKLEKVKGRQNVLSENKDNMKKEVDVHFERVISSLIAYKQQLLTSIDVKTLEDFNLLKGQENFLQTSIQNMIEYMSNIQAEDVQERMAFIMYSPCSTADILPEGCPPFLGPGILKYSEGCLEKSLIQKISGSICKSLEDTTLLKKLSVQSIKTFEVDQEQIQTLCYDSGLYWIFSLNKGTFRKCNDEGDCIDEIKIGSVQTRRNNPFCVVYNERVHAVYRNDSSTLFMLKDSQEKLFINVAPLLVVCLCLTSDGEILAGLANVIQNYFGIARYSIRGERKQFLTQIIKKWTPKPLLLGNSFRAYIVENVNGDICLSVETNLSNAVIVIRPNGDHRFTYEGKGSFFLIKPFLPRGICTNALGHILIADENNHGIHVLNKDGGFLTMLTIPGEQQAIPISLCIDRQNNLCIGCVDGKIRILKYLD